ncbi:hypothetical protein OAL45_00410 [bacterium]|nr:hypothetical protein [bacterium]MDB4744171.1 hypothetical protein [Verrucomicrobiota bacterium]MDC0317896.1 hypothetical protein [bacterium]
MNISEFERNKPRKTFQAINFAIKKYETYILETNPIMNDSDGKLMELSQEVLDDLNRIKNLFLKGL